MPRGPTPAASGVESFSSLLLRVTLRRQTATNTQGIHKHSMRRGVPPGTPRVPVAPRAAPAAVARPAAAAPPASPAPASSVVSSPGAATPTCCPLRRWCRPARWLVHSHVHVHARPPPLPRARERGRQQSGRSGGPAAAALALAWCLEHPQGAPRTPRRAREYLAKTKRSCYTAAAEQRAAACRTPREGLHLPPVNTIAHSLRKYKR